MARKVIQIACQPATLPQLGCGDVGYKPLLFALCDDGTIWGRGHGDDKWTDIENVPQTAVSTEDSST